MVLASILLGLSSLFSVSNAADWLSSILDRAKVLEDQASVVCDPTALAHDPIRTEIADRMFAESGPTQQLIDQIKSQALATNAVLENSEQAVLNHYSAEWEKKMSTAETKIELARKKLNSRSPASESLRADVRSAFAEYSALKTRGQKDVMFNDPALGAQLKQDLKKLRERKTRELKDLTLAGSRVLSAREKALGCYCKLRDTCPDMETMKDRTEYFHAMKTYQDAKEAANPSGKRAQSATSGQ